MPSNLNYINENFQYIAIKNDLASLHLYQLYSSMRTYSTGVPITRSPFHNYKIPKYVSRKKIQTRKERSALILLILGGESLLELVLDVRGDEVVGRELHGVVGASLGHRPEGGDVLEHVGEGDLGADGLDVAPLPEVSDESAARVDVSEDVAHVLLRGGNVDLHQGFHETRLGLAQALARRGASCDLEGHDAGIDVVVGAVGEGGLHAEDGETGDDSGAEDGLDALLDAGDVLLGDVAALDVGLELEVHGALLVELLGREGDLDARVLAGTSGLLLVGVVDIGRLGDGLAVGDLGGADVGLDVELALHAVDDDLEVKLAHALDDGLPGLLVAAEPEGRVLASEADEGVGHLLLIGLGLGLDCDLDDRLGEFHLLKDDGVLALAEGLSGGGVLESHERDDVAGDGRLDLGPVVGVHLKHAADALVLLLDGVVDDGAGLHDAGVDAGEG
mmetsp:Transcript_13376/g.27623  ORF Transcript_13376/g.27623 Transcript_13376/m.27623 type:complete len:447 (+) Transcript_13376:96-1436(+)